MNCMKCDRETPWGYRITRDGEVIGCVCPSCDDADLIRRCAMIIAIGASAMVAVFSVLL